MRRLTPFASLLGLATACARPLPPAGAPIAPLAPELVCGPVTPDTVTCPRGWGACVVTSDTGRVALRQPGARTPLATVVWRDADGDGKRDAEARYTYDARGNVTSAWIDGNGNGLPEAESRASYDARGLLIRSWSDAYFDVPGPREGRYDHAAAGQLTATTVTTGWGTTDQKRNEYDARGRLLRQGDTRYAYSAGGKLVREWTATWERQWAYDVHDRPIREWTSTGHDQRTTYDAQQRVVRTDTVSSPGGEATVGRSEYDAEGRVTRSWVERGGKIRSEDRNTYDAEGRLTQHWEDRDGDGAADQVEHVEYAAGGRVSRRWHDLDRDGKPDGDTRYTFDADGHLIRQTEGAPPFTSDARFVYDDDRLLRMWNESYPGAESAAEFDRAGNQTVATTRRDGLVAATHYEFDPAAIAALAAIAPPACTAASPGSEPSATWPQAPALALEEGPPRPPTPIGPSPPDPPALGRDGFVSNEVGLRLWHQQRAHVQTLTARAIEQRGWRRVPVHLVDPDAKPGNVKGLRIAVRTRACGPPRDYVIDAMGHVFQTTVAVTCARTLTVKVHGALPADDDVERCGTEPPLTDLYGETPAGARLQTPGPALPVAVAQCLELRPEQITAPPP